jgi:peptidoglycan-associated lipoprotein
VVAVFACKTMLRTSLALSLVTLVSVGCTKKATTKVSTAAPPSPASTSDRAAAPSATPAVAVSDDLSRRCQLVFGDVGGAPKFDYNEDALQPMDRTALEQIATCLTTGPLKGHTVRLVGRADPRGTSEYNLGLGTRRANTVTDYLRRLGVEPTQLTVTTRGDLDATGRDEVGWREDRRVDVELVQ